MLLTYAYTSLSSKKIHWLRFYFLWIVMIAKKDTPGPHPGIHNTKLSLGLRSIGKENSLETWEQTHVSQCCTAFSKRQDNALHFLLCMSYALLLLLCRARLHRRKANFFQPLMMLPGWGHGCSPCQERDLSLLFLQFMNPTLRGAQYLLAQSLDSYELCVNAM